MFEEQTEEVIVKRMLDKIPDDLDKRESSPLYNALAPTSLELAFAYSNLDRFLSYVFPNAHTPVEFIEKRANEEGIKIKQAENTIKKGYFYDSNKKTIDIPLGSRFSIDKLNFKAIEKIDIGNYKMECEKTGIEGNNPSGQLIPIDYIENLAIAELGEIIREGIDIESGEDLFNRYSEKIQKPVTSGNPNHYKQWAKEVPGVGDAKPVPLWNGPGTVKVVIIDSNKKAPSKELIDKVLEYIEAMRPIGPKVTVVGVSEKQINVTAKLILANGFNIGQVQQEFLKLLDKYLKDISFKLTYISIARIGNLLLNTPGVLDYTNLKVNNSTTNIGLQDEEIPVLGIVELGV